MRTGDEPPPALTHKREDENMAKKDETAQTNEQTNVQTAEAKKDETAQTNEQTNVQTAETKRGPRKMWINVHKPAGSQEDGRLVGVNGKNWKIKYNVDVQVPEEVYCVLRDAARAEAERDLYIERLTKK